MVDIGTLYEKAKEERVDLFIDILPERKAVNVKVFLGSKNFGRAVSLEHLHDSGGEALLEAFDYCLRRVQNGRCYSGCVNIGGD